MFIHPVAILLLLVMTAHAGYGQAAARGGKTPYEGRRHNAGDIRTMQMDIPIGKLRARCLLTYTLLEDPDGLFYQVGRRYKAQVLGARVWLSGKRIGPGTIADGFADRVVELADREISCAAISTTHMYWWFAVRDFNLDGTPDFAFINDLGYHSSPFTYTVWVNLRGKLVYWHGLSGVATEVVTAGKRVVSISDVNSAQLNYHKYRIENDTALVRLP